MEAPGREPTLATVNPGASPPEFAGHPGVRRGFTMCGQHGPFFTFHPDVLAGGQMFGITKQTLCDRAVYISLGFLIRKVHSLLTHILITIRSCVYPAASRLAPPCERIDLPDAEALSSLCHCPWGFPFPSADLTLVRGHLPWVLLHWLQAKQAVLWVLQLGSGQEEAELFSPSWDLPAGPEHRQL